MQILLQSVVIRNFLSFGNISVTFNIRNGINLISGYNEYTGRSNGSGKSNLIESIVWGFFGKTLKDITQDEVINWKNKKKCEVTIYFTKGNDEYICKRTLKPNNFQLFKNNEEIPPPSDKREFQAYFENNILESDYKTFTSLIHCNSNNIISIFKAPKQKKRELIANLFNLQYYSKISKAANSKLKQTQEKVNIEENSQKELNSSIKEIDEQNKKYNEAYEKTKEIDIEYLNSQLEEQQKKLNKTNNLLSNIEKSIIIVKAKRDAINIEDIEEFDEERYNSVIKELKNYENIDSYKEKLNKIDSKKKEIARKTERLNSDIEHIDSDLEKLNKAFEVEGKSECPTCGTEIDSEKIIQQKKEERNLKLNEKSHKQKKIERLSNVRTRLNAKYSEIEENTFEYENLENEKKNLEEQKKIHDRNIKLQFKINKYNNAISKLENLLSTYKDKKKEFENSISSISSEIDDNQKLLNKPNEIMEQIEKEKEKQQNIENQRKRIKEYLDENKKRKNEKRKQIEESKKRVERYNSIIDYLNYCIWLCKDENAKQYAISSITPILNKRTNYYLSEAGIGFYVKLDSWLNPTIKGTGIANASYDSLSAGEQKTLELAIQFAFLDVAKINATNFPNILLLDEILDSSIDWIGLDDILNIIRVKQKEDDLCVYIISHRKEMTDIALDHHYNVINSNGFSKLEEK